MQVSKQVEVRQRRAALIMDQGVAAFVAGAEDRATGEAIAAFRARFSRRAQALARRLSNAERDGRDVRLAKCTRMGEIAAELADRDGRARVLAVDLEKAWRRPIFFTRDCPLIPTTPDPDKDDGPDTSVVLPA